MRQRLRSLAALGLACLAGCWSSQDKSPKSPPIAAQAGPTELLSPSKYRNTDPAVAYVGDAECAKCHPQIAESYAAHPMGRSMREIAVSGHDEPDPAAPTSFEADGLTYSVSWDGKRMVHSEHRFDANGDLVHEKSEEVAYVVGAGGHGRSYLIQRGDSLWMSPITWYPQQEQWALSPNYDLQNQHFNRPIMLDCLFCHANRANHRTGTINLYRNPPFSGLSIGCERCHGPGELHAQRHVRGEPLTDSPDDTIVNPRDLDPVLRDGVCQQCHLAGDVRIVRRGRDPYDYRPGLPWHEYMAVFTKRLQPEDQAAVTSHEAQMRESRCYQASGPKLSCISCHDPHKKPSREEHTEYFRQRCYACHHETSCTELAAHRAATTPADNCLACHMPAIVSDVRHVAITDHEIPRRAKEAATAPEARTGRELSLVFFHKDQIDPQSAEAKRDLAVALMQLLSEHPEVLRPNDVQYARHALAAAVERHPTDALAAEALAHAQFILNRPAEALATTEAALERTPGHELLLAGGVLLAAHRQEWETARRYVDQLIELNPCQVRYRHLSAQVAIGKDDLDLAVRACEAGLELNPADQQLRRSLIRLLETLDRTQEAERHADVLMRSASVPQPK
jgi:hypothetical protein